MRRYFRVIFYAALILAAFFLARAFSAAESDVTAGAAGAPKSRVIALFGSFLAVLIVLGLAAAFHITRFLAERAEKFVLFGGPEVKGVPEIDLAERLRRREPIEAIRVLRDYLRRHPGEARVVARIAEIYEENLRNNLAAALEYEELLKQELPPENWGWAAIHLANLYIRFGKSGKAVQVLDRLVREQGQTLAARKARQRLAELGVLPEKVPAQPNAEG